METPILIEPCQGDGMAISVAMKPVVSTVQLCGIVALCHLCSPHRIRDIHDADLSKQSINRSIVCLESEVDMSSFGYACGTRKGSGFSNVVEAASNCG
jgi:hypothetical protein